MELNKWYDVTQTFTDSYGYQITQGVRVRFTSNGAYTSGRTNLRGHTLLKGALANVSLFPTTTKLTGLDKCLKALTRTATAEVEVELLESRKDQPNAHCNMTADIYVGSDPEVFVTTRSGNLIPAFEFLKAQDKKVTVAPRASMFDQSPCIQPDPYWDGFQAEFQIVPQCCHAYVTDNIQAQLVKLHELASAHSCGAKIDPTPVMTIPAKVLAATAPEHVALGCMPSLNAYGMMGEKPHDGRELPFRFAGFHVHHAIIPKVPMEQVVRSIDNIAGVMSVSVLAGLENPVRRQYYGLAGEYRTPKHGLEYRTLSSAVLWHPALTHLHLDFVRAGTQLAMAGLADLWEGNPEETIDIINKLDVDQARKALRRNKRLMIGLITRYYYTYGKPVNVFDELFMGGIAQHIEQDVEKNWLLTTGTWQGHTESAGCQMQKFAREHFGQAKVAVAKG